MLTRILTAVVVVLILTGCASTTTVGSSSDQASIVGGKSKATSKKRSSSDFASSGSSRASVIGSYNCSDFSSQEEAQSFFINNGFSAYRDPYNLDADNNGIACESVGKVAPSSSKCPVGKSWVRPYVRSNGARVRGHCRKRR